MKHNGLYSVWIFFSHSVLLGIVFLLNASGLTTPAASPLLIYIHIVLSAVFCVICMSLWVGFAATASMTIVLWMYPLSDIFNAVSLNWMLAHWKLILFVLMLAAAYSLASYYHAPKFFGAMRNMILISMLFALVILPAFGIDGDAVWSSIGQGMSNAFSRLQGLQ